MRTKRSGWRVLASAAALILVLAACGGDDDDDAASDATTTSAASEPDDTTSTTSSDVAPEEEVVTVAIASTDLGDTLVDERGMTLYLFENDSENESACNEGCSTAWPPLVVTGEPVFGEGLDAASFTTFARADGAMQVSVNGHPLYTFASDASPGDVTGQGVGDVWFAVGANGEKLEAAVEGASNTRY
jgi:predicted lipoprotein with Yx(FWY)xxD motif